MFFHLIGFCIVILSLSLHEYSHAYAAYRLGDNTAKDLGRMTLNPLKHIDVIGTLLLPFVLLMFASLTGGITPVFGYAKPVPVNYSKLSENKWKLAIVALAGPLANFIIAIFFCFIFVRISPISKLSVFFQYIFLINLVLCCFNMFPIPPLDGAKITAVILPKKYLKWMEHSSWLQLILIIILIKSGVLHKTIQFVSSFFIKILQ